MLPDYTPPALNLTAELVNLSQHVARDTGLTTFLVVLGVIEVILFSLVLVHEGLQRRPNGRRSAASGATGHC